MRWIFYLTGILWLMSGCQHVDNSGDRISPLPDTVSNSTSKKLRYMSEVIDDEPAVADYYYKRALLYLESREEGLALQDINKALELDAEKSEYFFVRACIHNLQKRYADALADAEQAEKKGLKKADLNLLLGKLYYHNHHPIQAVQYLRKSQEVFPASAEAFYYRGLISVDVGDTLTADQFLNKAILHKRDYEEAYRALIELYSKLGMYGSALAYLDKVLAQPAFSKKAHFHFLYGETLSKTKKKYREAVPWYARAVALDSTMWGVSYQLANYYVGEKEYIKAEAYLKKAIAVNPKIEGASYKLASIYEFHLKNMNAAKQQYETALALDPLNEDIRESIRRIEKRIAYEEYKKSPQYILDLLRRRKQEEMEQQNSEQLPVISNQ